ncbi:iron-containing alcohol dehydrogenase [Mycolicibacterium mengxianglii]|uniref:iron-containing alcohol dehydrogenase n=1 Tax=Mycolicibacterium mengxianglii TaxID=2736649 RepID=UPI0018EF1A39|nr:iron-containing alcohol dehydrogenase [Mycolicibacterium mengxianglii]
MTVNLAMPRFLTVGAGALTTAGGALIKLGVCRPLIVTDKYLVSSGATSKLEKVLIDAGCAVAVFSDTVPDPTTSSLIPAVEAVRQHGADCVIGFGGGSPMDTAKAIAVLGQVDEPMRRFKAPSTYAGPALPIVAIPTTSGSGSEATQFTVITDDDSDEKMLCSGLSFLPSVAIVDYQLSTTMPPRLTADTGVDALTHAIEAYVSRKANWLSDSLALGAIAAIGKYLRRAYRDGNDAEAREGMMFAATQAGIAFSNSSVCLVHGMSRPIGGHFRVAHGLSNAMLLPAVAEYSAHGAEARYAACARAYGVAHDTDEDAGATRKLIGELRQLCSDVEVPTPEDYGIDRAKWERLLPVMAEQALASGSPANNPVVPTAAEIVELYEAMYARA